MYALDDDKEWAQAWVSADQVKRRIDEYTSNRLISFSPTVAQNSHIEMQQLYFDLGIIKRPKIKNRKISKDYYSLNLNKTEETPFNRWVQKIEYINKKTEKNKLKNLYLDILIKERANIR